MRSSKTILIFVIFGVPFLLGTSIIGYWYYSTQMEKRALLPSFGEVPGFSLTSEEKRPFTNRDLLGKVSVADFMFTQCGESCPMMSTKMADLQKAFLQDPNVQLVSFSVDPENDTPETLSAYGRQYHAQSGKWIFLTGEKKSITALVKGGFHLGLDTEAGGAIMHSEKFVLIDQKGTIRGYYDSNNDADMKLLLRDAHVLSSKAST